MKNALRTTLALLAVLPLAACGGEQRTTTSTWTTIDSPGGGVTFEQSGVTIEADSSVRLVYRVRTQNGVETENVQTLNGHAFGVEDGAFVLGGREYGPTPEGSRVMVQADGVFVDGERRGELPPAVEPESGSVDSAEPPDVTR